MAVPTMFAGTGDKIFKYIKGNGNFTVEQIKILVVGNLVAFLIAIVAIKFLLTMLKKHGFRVWGVYRVLVGAILLIMFFTGYLQR